MPLIFMLARLDCTPATRAEYRSDSSIRSPPAVAAERFPNLGSYRGFGVGCMFVRGCGYPGEVAPQTPWGTSHEMNT